MTRDDIKYPKIPEFRDKTTGNYITQSLFLELSYTDTSLCLYTLKENDWEYNGKVYPSIKRLYLEIADPTEYQFAKVCFEGWNHWKRMFEKTNLLKPYIEDWRAELEVKLRSDGVRGMLDSALNGNPKSAQWLADKGFVEGGKKAGRPSRKSKQDEAVFKEQVQQQYGSDLERLKGKLN